MKDLWAETKEKPKDKKKILIIALIAILVIAFIVILIFYIKNENIRLWIDKNILRKEILQEQVAYIELEDENAQSYAYSQYLGVLSKNNFDIYNSSGNKEATLDLQITTPLFSANDRFLAVADKGGQKAYLITNKIVQWEKKVEGNISQIYVNKNGFVAIVITNTIYKTVIEMYNPEGEQLFRTFLSSTLTSDISISDDNKYLAIAEIDTSGTTIQSTVKEISVEKSQQDSTESIEKTYKSESGRLITNISYQNKNKLLCMYTDAISIMSDGKEEVINQNTDKRVNFSSIELSNSSVILEEKSSGLFTADSILRIINSENREEKEYRVGEVTKNLYAREDMIALNLGTEIEFVNSGGWLVKKYIANQEITNIVLSNQLAGIVYRNKIEIIKL